MKQISILTLLLLILFSCHKREINTTDSKKNVSIITIIFNKRSYSKDTIKVNKNEIAYKNNKLSYSINGSPVEYELLPNNINKTDTVKINTTKEILVSHPYNFYFKSLYRFKPGDIVTFDYPQDAPLCKIQNRDVKNEALNFDRDFDLSTALATSPLLYYQKFILSGSSIEKQYITKINQEKEKKLNTLLFQKKISISAYNLIKSQFVKRNSILTENVDLSNINYRNLVCMKANSKFNVPRIKIQKGFGNIKDYRAIFDSIRTDKTIVIKNKNYLLYNTLMIIEENFSPNDFKRYNEKFNYFVKDTNLVNDIRKKYLIDFEKNKKETENVLVTNYKRNSFSLDSLIKKNTGKLIYIDFWASWCGPCIAEIPFSKKLKKRYKNKNVVFLFISTDSNFDNWFKASKKEQLLVNTDSFLAINYPAAIFYKNLKIISIPRYIIYNKSGKLVDKDAPRPSDKSLIIEIDKFLAE